MKIKSTITKLRQDRASRGYFFASVIFLGNAAFLFYNFFLGVFYGLIWHFSVSFYYLLLMTVRAIMLRHKRKWKNDAPYRVKIKRIKLFKVLTVFLLMIDFVLIAPIALLVLRQKPVNLGQIPTIVMAAYTTYKIIMACVNYSKSKRFDDLTLQGLRIISLKEAIVSIITLQNTMIMVFGDSQGMLTLTICSSVGLWGLLIAISILQLRKYKMVKKDFVN